MATATRARSKAVLQFTEEQHRGLMEAIHDYGDACRKEGYAIARDADLDVGSEAAQAARAAHQRVLDWVYRKGVPRG
jgi:hypothetical protein